MDTSIYKTITTYLLEIISRNAGTPKFKLPSERVLALNFDTSRKPVRHAYDNLIARGYVVRVHGSGYYISDGLQSDKLLSGFQKKLKISFIIPSITTRYSHALLSGVSDFCTRNQVEYTIHVSDDMLEKENALLRSVPREGAMGIILFPSDDETAVPGELIRLLMRKYPIVQVDRRLPNVETSFVASDDHQSMMDAVSFLYRSGFRNPVYATPSLETASSVVSRINGYTHGLLKYYKIASPSNLLILSENRSQQKNEVLQHLRKYPDTDVIIVPGVMTAPVMSALQTMNGHQVKIMAFDDELNHAQRELFKPFFILQDGYHIGYVAAETLYNHILGDARPRVHLLPVTVADAEGNPLTPGENL